MGKLRFGVNPVGADREVVGDVVEHDIDVFQGHARALVIGETIQRELQHPIAPIGRRSRRGAGLPVDDLDPSAPILASVDGIELADDLLHTRRAAQGHIDLGFDLDRSELGPFRSQERLLQLPQGGVLRLSRRGPCIPAEVYALVVAEVELPQRIIQG